MQCFFGSTPYLVSTRQLIQHGVVAPVVGVGLQQLLIQADCIVVSRAVQSVDIFRKLLCFCRFKLQITQASHCFSAQFGIVGNQVKKRTVVLACEIGAFHDNRASPQLDFFLFQALNRVLFLQASGIRWHDGHRGEKQCGEHW